MTEPASTQPTPSWTVTNQAEKTIINSAGNAVDVMAITFQLADGTTATVNVPLSAYTPDNVRAAIAAKAATLDAVNNLTS